jgi:hypothetical protein
VEAEFHVAQAEQSPADDQGRAGEDEGDEAEGLIEEIGQVGTDDPAGVADLLGMEVVVEGRVAAVEGDQDQEQEGAQGQPHQGGELLAQTDQKSGAAPLFRPLVGFGLFGHGSFFTPVHRAAARKAPPTSQQ